MPRLHMEFVSAPKNHLFAIVSLGLALMAVSGCFVVRDQLLTDIAEHQNKLGKIERQLRLQQPSRVQRQDDPRALQEVQRIATSLTLPWTEVFESLQKLTPATISLAKIQPNLTTGQIVIQGYAKDYQSFLDYLSLIETAEHWHHAQPISQELSNTLPDKPLNFQLSAQWSSS